MVHKQLPGKFLGKHAGGVPVFLKQAITGDRARSQACARENVHRFQGIVRDELDDASENEPRRAPRGDIVFVFLVIFVALSSCLRRNTVLASLLTSILSRQLGRIFELAAFGPFDQLYRHQLARQRGR